MGRSRSTKAKIIGMISSRNKTLSDISRELGLAPSTVSQHLQELKEAGAILEVENEHVRKWKYYELNPNFDYSTYGIAEVAGGAREGAGRMTFFYSIAIIACVGLALFAFYSLSFNVQGSSLVQIKLTDPASVPNGTQGLYINYSSVAVHTVGNGGAEWIEANSSGRVNLLSLTNVSQVMAGIEVVHGSGIDRVRFNISSAQIAINGTEYGVLVPGSQITVGVLGNRSVNASSEVLVDFFPTVVATYVNGSAQFVMVHSAWAFLTRNMRFRERDMVGKTVRLDLGEMARLMHPDAFSITGASLSSGANGSVDFGVTVRNNYNASVEIGSILILGNQNVSASNKAGCRGLFGSNAPRGNCTAWNSAGNRRIYQGDAGRLYGTGGLCFGIYGNGTVAQFYGKGALQQGSLGYSLMPGAARTFAFSTGLGAAQGNATVLLRQGATYRIAVLGQFGWQEMNVTDG